VATRSHPKHASAEKLGLIDRAAECEAIDRLLAGARAGVSGALVLRGEPGVGKTALLEYAVEFGDGMLVVRLVGTKPEVDVPFAALHELLSSLRPALDPLSDRHRDALGSTLGLMPTLSTDRLMLGAALLNLLSNAAEEQPLLCIIEDAQWLDPETAETLAFVCRRLDAEGIALLLATRDLTSVYGTFDQLAELHVEALSEEAAGRLISSLGDPPPAGGVQDRVITEGDGNPRALLEFARALSRSQLAGSAPLPDLLPISRRLGDAYLEVIRQLPVETRTLLLIVAAVPRCPVDVFWRAAEALGVSLEGVHAAEADGLLSIGSRVRFPDPLLRPVVYGAARPNERRRVHQALAEAIGLEGDPGGSAWHRAAAAPVVDEELASELAQAAALVAKRDGCPGTARLLERSAGLTPDHTLRIERTLAAARAHLEAGTLRRASTLLAEAEAESAGAGELAHTQTQRLRAELAVARGEDGVVPTFVAAARAVEDTDPTLAREIYLEALEAAILAGELGGRDAVNETARAARGVPRGAETEETSADLLLDGITRQLTGDREAAVPMLRAAIATLRRDPDPRWIGLAGHVAGDLWDDEALHSLAVLWVELARESEALTALPNALRLLARYEILVGRFEVAEQHLDEALEISAAAGNAGIAGGTKLGEFIIAAWRGNEVEAVTLAEASIADAAALGKGILISFANYARAVLENGLGRYGVALTAAQQAVEGWPLWIANRAVPELVEAAVRCGERDIAVAQTEELARMASPSGSAWALGMLARSRALVADDRHAEALYLEAIDQLKRCRVSPELARARLLYGEWLRRHRRRADAREPLRTACATLTLIGARGFAERAEAELRASGEHLRREPFARTQTLTPHEERIGRLVSEGASNAEIAEKLFVSPRTVEYHLSKIFRKVGVSSRKELIADGRTR
jgi:DNA-binding CsgD family transcriptional regulator/tetratricopeptide (TPR) repeat protein